MVFLRFERVLGDKSFENRTMIAEYYFRKWIKFSENIRFLERTIFEQYDAWNKDPSKF